MQAAQARPGTRAANRRRLHNYAAFSQDAILVLVSAFFFYMHAGRVFGDGVYTSVPFAIEQGLLVGMFLTRRRSLATTTRPIDWLVAIGGWMPLAFLPTDDAPESMAVAGTVIQMAGLSLTIVCFLALGRSFGVVAANRGLKVHGPYRLIRHPIYFSHAVTMTGFLVANAHPYNFALYVATMFFQLNRIRAEERVLTESGDYGAYASQVRWRLIPGLY